MQLAGEMTAVELAQRDFLLQPVAAEQIGRALEQKPGRHAAVADLEDFSPGEKRRASALAKRLTSSSCVSRNRGKRWALRSETGTIASICSAVLIDIAPFAAASVRPGGHRFNLDEKGFAIPPRAWRPPTSTSSPTRASSGRASDPRPYTQI